MDMSCVNLKLILIVEVDSVTEHGCMNTCFGPFYCLCVWKVAAACLSWLSVPALFYGWLFQKLLWLFFTETQSQHSFLLDSIITQLKNKNHSRKAGMYPEQTPSFIVTLLLCVHIVIMGRIYTCWICASQNTYFPDCV